MALGDILEAVAQGASGGFGSYAQYLESEREKKRREKERLEDVAFRDRQIALQEALADDARARQRALEETTMIEKGYRLAGEDEPLGPVTFQPRGVKLFDFDELQRADLAIRAVNIPAPEVEDGRIVGTGAAAAPWQTYPAVQKALADTTKEYEGPEISLPSIEQRGFERRELGGRTYLRPDEELLSQVQRDRELREKIDAEERALQNAVDLAAAQIQGQIDARREAGQAFLSGRALDEFALYGTRPPVIDEELDRFGKVYNQLYRDFVQKNEAPPTAADRAELGIVAGQIVGGMTPDQVLARLGIDALPGDDGAGAGGAEGGGLASTGDPILDAELARQERQRALTMSEREARQQYEYLQNSLEIGEYKGRPISPQMQSDILNQIRGLRSRFGFPIRGVVEDVDSRGALGIEAIR